MPAVSSLGERARATVELYRERPFPSAMTAASSARVRPLVVLYDGDQALGPTFLTTRQMIWRPTIAGIDIALEMYGPT